MDGIVVRADEVQAVGGERRGGKAAVPASQYLGDPGRVAAAAADGDEIGVGAWHSAERNALKSCVPTRAAAAARMASASSRWKVHPTCPDSIAGRTRDSSRTYA